VVGREAARPGVAAHGLDADLNQFGEFLDRQRSAIGLDDVRNVHAHPHFQHTIGETSSARSCAARGELLGCNRLAADLGVRSTP